MFLLTPVLLFAVHPATAKDVVGWLEKANVYFNGDIIVMTAKIDSGAKTSSINGKDYELFFKNGRQWVRFRITNYKNNELFIEKPTVRTTKIKRHFGKFQERPVIMIGLCLGNVYRETEVNLVDRSGLNYQLLIGRKFLAGHFLIDSGAKFITGSDCKKGR